MIFPFPIQFYAKNNQIYRISLDAKKSSRGYEVQWNGAFNETLKLQTIDWLTSYQQKKEPDMQLPLDFSLISDFCSQTYEALQKVTFGEVTCYEALAKSIGNPRAARAIGLAMKTNPFPLVIPCHRVIQKSGRIGGFLYGANFKSKLLAFEGINL